MKTLAELKRHANQGNMSLELLERFHKTGDAIPEQFRGIRRVIKATAFGLLLQYKDDGKSRLHFDSAKLVEYDGDTLVIYEAGLRNPTEAEQTVLDEWAAIEKEYEAQNPFGNSYWKKKSYFEKCPFPYMSGFSDEKRSKRYLPHNGMVLDKQVRGEMVLKYKVHFS